MDMRPEWEGFNPDGLWTSEVNVRDFIQANYTEYDGDESFLAGPTSATKKLFCNDYNIIIITNWYKVNIKNYSDKYVCINWTNK